MSRITVSHSASVTLLHATSRLLQVGHELSTILVRFPVGVLTLQGVGVGKEIGVRYIYIQ